MKLQCKYIENTWSNYQNKFYCCEVQNQKILEDEEIEFIGNHVNGKTSIDVTAVFFYNCVLNKLPQNLSNVFPNLKTINISSSALKTISKSDLKDHKQLIFFYCFNSAIEYLPGNLFEDSKCIEWIQFNDNKKLKIIEPNILDNLESLKHIELMGTLNLDIVYSIFPQTVTKFTLEEFKNELAENFFALNSQIVKDFVLKFENPLEKLKEYMKRVKTAETKVKMLEIKAEITENIFNQKLQKGLFGDIKCFIQNDNTKDFKIIIDAQEFPVHKFLLAARSPTLAELLENNPEVENLNLVDISVEIFEKILKFLYTDELPGDDGTNFVHLFGAAGRLQITELRNYAAQEISDNISTVNVMELLRIANLYNQDDLIQKAFQEIKNKYLNIPFKDEWSRDPKMVSKVIDTYEKKEEAKRQLDAEFENLVM